MESKPQLFPYLKSLHLSEVILTAESFDNFLCNVPLLEELTLRYCPGFEEIKLSSRSIKRLIIDESRTSVKKVAIEVPNILYFELTSTILPYRTTSKERKRLLQGCVYVNDNEDDVVPRILKLFDMVNALSQSQISLTLSETFHFKMNQIEWDFNGRPVAMEHLRLVVSKHCQDSITHYLNALFRIFRPRYTNAVRSYLIDDKEVTKFLWKTLILEREKTEYGWEQHLEEVSIEASDEKEKVWHPVQWTCFTEWSRNEKIRFRLKWRD